MADNSNTLANRINNPLEELSFDQIIGAPLRACAEAQQEAASASYEYLKSMGLEEDDSGLAFYKPAMMSFLFVVGGVTQRLTVPLLSIIPVPYLQIDHINLKFQATVEACDKNNLTAKFAATAPKVKLEAQQEEKATITAKENIDINICATASDVPPGMAKLIEILQTQLTEINDYLEIPDTTQTA